MPSSRGSFQPRDQTQVSCIAGRFFTIWTSKEALLWAKPCPKSANLVYFLQPLREVWLSLLYRLGKVKLRGQKGPTETIRGSGTWTWPVYPTWSQSLPSSRRKLLPRLGSWLPWFHLWTPVQLGHIPSTVLVGTDSPPSPADFTPTWGLSACHLPPCCPYGWHSCCLGVWAQWGRLFPSSWYQIFPCSFLLSFLAGVLGLWTAIPPRLSPVFGAEPGNLSQAWGFLQEPGLAGSGRGEHSHRHPTGAITTFWSLPPGSSLMWLVVSRPASSCPGVSLCQGPAWGSRWGWGLPRRKNCGCPGLGWAGRGQTGFTDQMPPPLSPLFSSSCGVSQGGGSERWSQVVHGQTLIFYILPVMYLF